MTDAAELDNPAASAADVSVDDVRFLVERTEVRDIRLQRFTGELVRTPPEEIDVRLSNAEPRYSRQPGLLLVLFSHKLDYVEPSHDDLPETPIGSIETTHIVEVEVRGDDQPSDDAVSAFIGGNLLFMVYPYVRAALHRLPSEFGLPSILLPYLRRRTEGIVSSDMPE